MTMGWPSAVSSSTASGLAWHTRSNCSGGGWWGGQRLPVDGKRTLAADPNSQDKVRAILASMDCFRPRDKLALRGAATRQG